MQNVAIARAYRNRHVIAMRELESTPVTDSRRILVVEDDDAIRALIKFLVERESWIADEVSDGTEALSRIQSNRYDAIVLDLMLPGLSGDAILTEIRRSHLSELGRIVIVTASPGFARNVDTTGVGAVLVKPFDIEQLLDALRRITA